MKKSYDPARSKATNPNNLGARPKTKAYPTIPTTLKEEATPTVGRAENWVQENEFEHKIEVTSRENHGGQKAAWSVNQYINTVEPPDYNQTMNMQPIIPQPNMDISSTIHT